MLLVTGRELIVASDSLRISISLDPLAWETGRGGGEEGGQGGRREAGEREERGGRWGREGGGWKESSRGSYKNIPQRIFNEHTFTHTHKASIDTYHVQVLPVRAAHL